MTPVFADTFFFLALLNSRDRAHQKARAANLTSRSVVTSGWILIELADHLCDEANRHLFGQVLDAIASDRRYEIMAAEQGTLDEATKLYRQRPDKDWSLTDCTLFVLMRQRHITEALTADRHFEQAGFRPLF